MRERNARKGNLRVVMAGLIFLGIAASPYGKVSAATAEDFARDVENNHVSLSPAGDRLAIATRTGGNVVLNVIQLSDKKSLGTWAVKGGKDVQDFYWDTNDRLLFGLSRSMGNKEKPVLTGDLMAVYVDSPKVKLLLGQRERFGMTIDGLQRDWEIVDMLEDDPDGVLIAIYEYEGGELPFLYRMNPDSGRMTRLLQSRNRFTTFMTDHKGQLRFQSGSQADGTDVLLYRASDNDEWKEIGRFAQYRREEPGSGSGGGSGRAVEEKQSGSFSPLNFAPDNKTFYYWDSRDAETAGVFSHNPDQPQPKLLFRNDTYDVDSLLPSRKAGDPIGVAWHGERQEWSLFEPRHPDATLFDSIRRAFGNRDMSIVSFSRDRSRVIVYAWSDVDPGAYYLVDLDKKQLLARFATRDWIKPEEMSTQQPVSLKARDGTDLHGYLTVPRKPAADGRKRMVVLVHGGPIGVRDTWGFDPEVQWLASNGYSVLQVNYRGSGGYGKSFTRAGYGEWGGKMQDDVTDATRWAIEKGHADKSAICIAGTSYGAYAALMGAVREPDLYRCAIGVSGVYDLELLKRTNDTAQYAEGRVYMDAAIGKDEEQLRRASPAWRAAEIKVPVLLAHGGEDRRTPQDQYRRMQEQLERNGKPVETLFKKNEGHGFHNEANRAELYRKMIEFLEASTGPAN